MVNNNNNNNSSNKLQQYGNGNIIQWQKDYFPHLFPSKETANRLGLNTFAKPSFIVYESESLLEVGRCKLLSKGGMDKEWVDGYTQPRFLLRPMSLIALQGEAIRLFSVQYYYYRGCLGQATVSLYNNYLHNNDDDNNNNLHNNDADNFNNNLHNNDDNIDNYLHNNENNNNSGRGFIIGDGTGVGKSREIAAMSITAILVEEYIKNKMQYIQPQQQYNVHQEGPLIIWLTCNELLFKSCKQAFNEVLHVPNQQAYCISNITNNGFTIPDLEGNDLYIQFITLKSLLSTHNNEINHICIYGPTIMFLTYNHLMTNFEEIRQITEKFIPCVVICDEFHKAKNISDSLKSIIANHYIKSRKDDNNDRQKRQQQHSLYTIVKDSFYFQKKKDNSRQLQLSVADSFKLFVDILKKKTFFIMSSATPFQSNNDLHIIDHIIRNIAPHYYLLKQCNITPTGINSLEYSTLFLESIIKLLYNKGIYVSRTISTKGIKCSIVQKPVSNANTYMIDEICCYLAEMKNLSKTAYLDMGNIKHYIDNFIKSKKWKSSTELISALKKLTKYINTGTCSDISMGTSYKLVFMSWPDAFNNKGDSSESHYKVYNDFDHDGIEIDNGNDGIEIDNDIDNDGIEIDNDGIEIDNDIDNDGIEIDNDIHNDGIEIDNEIDNDGIEIDNDIDNDGIEIDNDIDNDGIEIDNDIDNDGIEIDNDIDNDGIEIDNDIDNDGIEIDNDIDNDGIEIDNDGIEIDNDRENNNDDDNDDDYDIDNDSENNNNNNDDEENNNNDEEDNKPPKKFQMKNNKINIDESLMNKKDYKNNDNADEYTSRVFASDQYFYLSNQLKVNFAACCVAINKNILLSLKSKNVLKYIRTIRKQKESQKMVVSVEQTGDSFYNHIMNELTKYNNNYDELKTYYNNKTVYIKRLSLLDKAPASHYVVNAYRSLLRILLLDTTYRVLSLQNEKMCFFLLPRLPPPAALMLLEENFVDQIEDGVGDGKYIEVTKRKYEGRLTKDGILKIIPVNTSAKNIYRDFQLFKHSNNVDVAIVGRMGNTGFDFHDSKDNISKARRIHIIADLPHDAISFLQSIGRTHRNNQRSLPKYFLFLTNIPTEKKFIDTLESRVKDSKAGSHGDRYCQNTLSLKRKSNEDDNNNINNNNISNNNYVNDDNNLYIDKVDFLENDLVMKVLGTTLRLLAGEFDLLYVFLKIAKMGYRNGKMFIPLEGLENNGDSKNINNIYLSIILFAFECASILLYKKKKISSSSSSSFLDFSQVAKATVSMIKTKRNKKKVLSHILKCLCYFYDSTIMDFALRGTVTDKRIENVLSIAVVFWEKFSPNIMIKYSHFLKSVKKYELLQLTVRETFIRAAITVFGYSSKEHEKEYLSPPNKIITLSLYDSMGKIISKDDLPNIPILIACNLLNMLKEKNPHLLLDLLNEITPYEKNNKINYNNDKKNFKKKNINNIKYNNNCCDSCLLSLSRLLANRTLTYKQFRNYFMMMPLVEQNLLQSLFSKVQEWLSTERGFSKTCMMRKTEFTFANYTKINQCPHDVSSLYTRLKDNGEPNVGGVSDFEIECQLCEGHENDNYNKINNYNNFKMYLTPKNTIFVNTLFENLLLTNTRNDLIKIKFNNCDIFNLPPVAFYKL
uniref:Wsv026-like protein n=1 Tax=Metapenaeus joyneri majanivirus TaxID=2984280 RepID=A0A9C7CFF6_9VIRU|nr:MAG: wsv026-like protein [Metapenaeus joyneri majanivirus]